MKLITYECSGRKHYGTCDNVFEWLRDVNKYDDGPYLILNIVEIEDDADIEFCTTDLNGI